MKKISENLETGTNTNIPLLFLATIDMHWQEYLSKLKDSQKELSADNVHDLRIAARRLRVMLQMMQHLQKKPGLKKAVRRLKRQASELDDLRDTQVMLKEVEGEVPQMQELGAFRECLLKQEKKLLKHVRKGFKSLKTGRTLREIVRWVEALDKDEMKRLPGGIMDVMDEVYGEIKARQEKMDPADPATIHQMRIPLRRFRYLADASHMLLPGFPPETLEKIKDLQDKMGEVQDMAVLLHSLEDFARQEPAFDPRKPLDYFHNCLSEATCTFLDNQGMLDTFWRAKPELPFPWEE